MGVGLSLVITGEVLLLLFIVWGYTHEAWFISFERRAWHFLKHFRRCIRIALGKKLVERYGLTIKKGR